MPNFNYNTVSSGIDLTRRNVEFTNLSTSEAIKIWGSPILNIKVPANFLGTTLTFLVNTEDDGSGDYLPFYNVKGEQVSISVAASRLIGVHPVDFFGVRYLKLQSNQTETATLQMVMRAIR